MFKYAYYSYLHVIDQKKYDVYDNIHGKSIHVTIIVNSPLEIDRYQWDDAVYIGKVIKFLKTVYTDDNKSIESLKSRDDKNKEICVTPWSVEGVIDYAKLIDKFGTSYIDDQLIDKFKHIVTSRFDERIKGFSLDKQSFYINRFTDSLAKSLTWMRRGIFFSHRCLDKFLDAYNNDEPIFLYTGRGPSSDSMHIGHLISFLFIKWLQDVLICPLVIQIADDEKFYFKKLSHTAPSHIDFDVVYKLGFENAKDIIACDFNPELTFIFSNRDHRINVSAYENFVSMMKKQISARQVAKTFGFGTVINVFDEVITKIEKTDPMLADKIKQYKSVYGCYEEHYLFSNSDINVGCFDWPFYQAAAAFSNSFPHIFGNKPAHCLILHGIDQDLYFREARDIADKMNLIKPYSIMCKFVPKLTGSGGKMSSTENKEGTIFLTDDVELIKSKIIKYAFSGSNGNGSLKEHKMYGGNPTIDIACQYLEYFEFDDVKLNSIISDFKKGIITCKQTKELMTDKIVKVVSEHQARRKILTDNDLEEFYKYKSMFQSK